MAKLKDFPINSAFVLALVILAVIAWLSYRNTTAMIESDRWEDHTYAVIQEFDRLLSTLKDAEQEQRGYIITGQESYLKSYNQATLNISGKLSSLERLTADDPQERAQLEPIRALIGEKLAELAKTIAIRRSNGFQAAYEVLITGPGKAASDEIQKRISAAQAEENRILQQEAVAKAAEARGSIRDVIAGCLLSFVLLYAVFFLLKREVAKRVGTEKDLMMHRDHLNELVDARTLELAQANSSLQEEIEHRRKTEVILQTEIDVRKHAEEALKQARNELEDRVQERTAELSQAVAKLHDEVDQRSLAEQSLHERTDQLRLLASELTLAEQRERQRLAQILHDGLQQILVAAKFRLALVEHGSDLSKGAEAAADLIDDAIETSRSLTAELSPPILREGGLVSALEWLARWMQDKHGLLVSLTTHHGIEQATEEVIVLLFQATRELLFNIVKHAGVKAARVEVCRLNGLIQVAVEDEGLGFDPSQLRTEGGHCGGFGLFSVRERLNLLGGWMEIDSAPGAGSRFKLIAPYLGRAEPAAPSSNGAQTEESPVAARRQESAPASVERKIRVMLVDDHMVMRQGLAGLIRIVPDMEIVGEASDGQSAVTLVREPSPDVVLMDVNMQNMDGIQAAKLIHAEMPEVRIIGLSMFEQGEKAAAMREAGAVAYLVKSGPSDAVIDAIRTCVQRTGNVVARRNL